MQICTVYAFISAIELPRIPAYLPKIMYDDFSNYMKVKRNSWSVHFFAIHYYMMISSHLRGNLEWRKHLDRIISDTNFNDMTIRDYCVKNNRRGFHMFCKEKEETICTMLK